MADLVTSESRRYLHGIQNTIIADDETGVALNVIHADNQLALLGSATVTGTLTIYGDFVVSGLAGGAAPSTFSALNVTVTPTGSISSTNAQAALAELDSEKEPLLTYARIISVLGFTPLSPCGYGSCYGLKYGGRVS